MMTLEQSNHLAVLRREVTSGRMPLGEFVRRARAVAAGLADDASEWSDGPFVVEVDDRRPEVTAVCGSVRRRVVSVPAGRYQVLALFGSARIDLTDVRLDGDDFFVDATAVCGTVKLVVPAGVEVEVHGSPLFGTVKDAGDHGVVAGAPRIVVRAAPICGTVKVARV